MDGQLKGCSEGVATPRLKEINITKVHNGFIMSELFDKKMVAKSIEEVITFVESVFKVKE